jgi:hypothetical protein
MKQAAKRSTNLTALSVAPNSSVGNGPDASRATKVVVSIVPSEDAEPGEMRDW